MMRKINLIYISFFAVTSVYASTICLPIQIPEVSPISFALNELKKTIAASEGKLSVSCSQPDFQLYWEVDPTLDDADYFVLIISDMNIEISGGNDRAISYALLELCDQLGDHNFNLSSLRSVVFRPHLGIRGLSLHEQIHTGLSQEDWDGLLPQMTYLRLNYLEIHGELFSNQKQLIKHAAEFLDLQVAMTSPAPLDQLAAKGVADNQDRTNLPTSQGLNQPPTSVLEHEVHHLFNQPFSVFSDSQFKIASMTEQKNVDRGAVLHYFGTPFFKKRDGTVKSFLVKYSNFYTPYASAFLHPMQKVLNLPNSDELHCGEDHYSDIATDISNLLQKYFSAFFGDEFKWSTFQFNNLNNQWQFLSVPRWLQSASKDSLVMDFQSFTEKGRKATISQGMLGPQQLVDSLESLLEQLDFKDEICATEWVQFSHLVSYTMHKIKAVMHTADFLKSGGKNKREKAVSSLVSAKDYWEKYWKNRASGPSDALTAAQFIELAERDLAQVKILRR